MNCTHQASLYMGFSRQEYWSGLLFPFPRDLPNSGIEPVSSALAGRFFIAELTREAQNMSTNLLFLSTGVKSA